MEELREIISICDNFRFSLDQANGENSKISLKKKFIKGVRGGKFQNDEEALGSLFKGSSKNSYRIFKSRFQNELGKVILSSDLKKGHSRFTNETIKGYRYLMMARILEIFNRNKSTFKFAHRAFEIGKTLENTEIQLRSAEILFKKLAIYGQRKEYEFFKDQLKILLKKKLAETELLIDYHHFIHLSCNSYRDTDGFVRGLEKLKNRAESNFTKFSGFFFRVYLFRIRSVYFECHRNFADLIGECEDFEQFANSRKNIVYASLKGEILLRKGIAYTASNSSDKGKVLLKKALQLFTPGSYNWHLTAQFLFLINIKNGEYSECLDILLRKEKNKKNLPAFSNEKWIIYESYLIFIYLGEIHPFPDVKNHFLLRKFSQRRLIRNINEIRELKKDKHHVNKSILVLEILYYFLADKGGLFLIEKKESLKTYISKYLKNENSRFKTFMKFLFVIMKEDKGTCERDLSQMEKAFQTQFGPEYLTNDEIIPYPIILRWICLKSRSKVGLN